MTTNVKILPKCQPTSGPLVVALVYDDLCTFEFGIAVEIFGLPRPEMGPSWYRFAIASVTRTPITARGGFTMHVNGGLSLLARASIIVIPGWADEGRAAVPPELIRALSRAFHRGATIAAICGGAYVVARAGLLNGKRATTHWKFTEDFRHRFPDVRLQDDVLYVDEGHILTSAGSAAGIDLCLHLVRRDFGPAAANIVARRLVVPPHREGGQAQFVRRPILPIHENKRLGALLDDLRRRLDQPHTVSSMANEAGMSVRTFIRRFTECTGRTPGEWLVSERLALAREMLEASRSSPEDIAITCGFGTVATMRHHFRERLGTNPSSYRRSFTTLPP